MTLHLPERQLEVGRGEQLTEPRLRDFIRGVALNFEKLAKMFPNVASLVPEPWIAFPFGANWGNYGGTWQVCQYRKDAFGKVHLRGLASKTGGTPANSDLIGTLPVGYRPPADIVMVGGAGEGETPQVNRFDVTAGGNVQLAMVGAATAEQDYSSLSVISFWTD